MKEIKSLDGLRGLAALYVLIHHARLYLTLPFQNGLGLYPEKYEWYDKITAYSLGLFKFGHEAVIIFFVLSGFVIHLKQAHSNFKNKDFSTEIYLRKRIVRIYPTLLVSFLLCLLMDFFTHICTGENINLLLSKYSISNFLYNLFLIPYAPIWGTNYPMWSLKHEWFFYLMYPLLLSLHLKLKVTPIILGILLFSAYCFGYKIPYIGAAAYTMLLWLLGCLLAYIYNNKRKFIKYLPTLLFLSCIYPLFNREVENPIKDLLFALIVLGFLSIILLARVPFLNKYLMKLAWLGTFSYSIYLLHTPFLTAFKSIIIYYSINKSLPYHHWYVLLSILVILPTIYSIYYFSERFAINYKKKIN